MQNLVQNTPEWVKWRNENIGASEVAAIIGICPYNTPYGVWQVKTGRSKGFVGNLFTQHGHDTEARARALYELLTMTDMTPRCATHPKYPVCIASLDGANDDGTRLLEIKCPKGLETLKAALEGRVIDHYIPQVQMQLAVTGADQLDFFVYHEESKQSALVVVEPDVEYQGMLIAQVVYFWTNYVLTDTPPPLTDRDVKVIENDIELEKLCDRILLNKETLSKAELDAMKAEAILMGGHPKIRCGSVQISTVKRAGKFSFHKLTVGQVKAEVES